MRITKLSFDELRVIAQLRNIRDYENKSKEDLIKALRKTPKTRNTKTRNKTKTRNTKTSNNKTRNKTKTKARTRTRTKNKSKT